MLKVFITNIKIDNKYVDKKVSYRKQIAHQHSCHKNFARTSGIVDPVIFFLLSSLIIKNNFIAVSYRIGVGGSQKCLVGA